MPPLKMKKLDIHPSTTLEIILAEIYRVLCEIEDKLNKLEWERNFPMKSEGTNDQPRKVKKVNTKQ